MLCLQLFCSPPVATRLSLRAPKRHKCRQIARMGPSLATTFRELFGRLPRHLITRRGALSISADALPKIVPDTAAQVKYLSYGHAALSDDTVDIQLDGLLLKSVASTSSDQTAKAVEAFNSLLTEVGTAKSAFNAPRCCRTCSGRHSAVDGPGMHVSFNFGHRNRSLSQEASATAT